MYQSTAHVGARPTTAQVSTLLIVFDMCLLPRRLKLTAGESFNGLGESSVLFLLHHRLCPEKGNFPLGFS